MEAGPARAGPAATLGHVSVRRLVVVAAGITLTVGAAAAAAASGATVRFRPVAQGFVANGHGPKHGFVVAVRSRTGARSVGPYLTPEAASALAGVDISKRTALAVFRGVQPSSGYSIGVLRISRGDGVVRIVVRLGSPSPANRTLPAFSRPFAVVTVPRSALSAADAWVLAGERGVVLARGSV